MAARSLKVGVVNEETWAFFREVYAELAQHHQTDLFEARRIVPFLMRERLSRHLFSRDLKAFLRSHDVVFFEWSSELLAAATRLPKTCGIVTRLHRYEMYRWADQIEWEAVDCIILVSEAKRREFCTRFPGQAAKVAVIPEAISFDLFNPLPRTFGGNIGILCSLIPRKRVYELILWFYELIKTRDGFHLHVAGGKRPLFADYYEALHALVDRLSLQDKVTFYGDVADPSEWYRHIDVFVSNSYSEGLQVSPMEAIASGCYCLSHWWQGAEELLPEEDLYLTDRELMDKLLDYCNATEARKQAMRDRQRTIISERFDVERTKVQIRQLVEEVGASWGRR